MRRLGFAKDGLPPPKQPSTAHLCVVLSPPTRQPAEMSGSAVRPSSVQARRWASLQTTTSAQESPVSGFCPKTPARERQRPLGSVAETPPKSAEAPDGPGGLSQPGDGL